jgi:hypothetical protein
MTGVDGRVEQILAWLDERDVAGGFYPTRVVDEEDRRRWNQCRLLALALYREFEPSMLPGEYSQSVFMMAGSIYVEDRTVFLTGTDDEPDGHGLVDL